MAFISYVFPPNGILISQNFTFKYPTFHSLFVSEKSLKTDISKIIALADKEEKMYTVFKTDSISNNLDTLPAKKTDSISTMIETTKAENFENLKDAEDSVKTNIQYKNNFKNSLDNFFNSLWNLSNEPKSVRILHYGDSQIEGDRISDYLRLKLQNQFGGEGPGLISFMPVTPSVINKLSWSKNWDKYTVFTGKDKRVKHDHFGALALLTRFTNYKALSDTSDYKTAWVKVVTTKNGGPKSSAFNNCKLFYGGAQAKTHIELYENGSLNNSDSLLANGNFNIKEFNLNQKPLLLEFKFKGKDSPDFYGLSLEGSKGVMVDNIGLRGSSGTFFNQINFEQLKQFYNTLNVKLIILQFGGNVLPYIKTREETVSFGNYLKFQIQIIKKIAPQTSILVVGPADMSVKIGEAYETHPQVENLRDALRKTAFETNCAFFDMYACMGGKNSMVSWVDLGIAAKDYVHFSPVGARKIAVLLHASLMNDYNNYILKHKRN